MRLLFALASESRLKFRASGGMERCFWNLLFEMSKRHQVDAVCRSVHDTPPHLSLRVLGPAANGGTSEFEMVTADYSARVADVANQYDRVVAFNFPQLLPHLGRPAICIFFNDGVPETHLSAREHLFVFPSEWLRREFLDAGFVDTENSCVLPMGVDSDRFVPLVTKGRATLPLTLLFAAVWHPGKGIREFLEMCATLSYRKLPFRALLVGSTGLWDFGDQEGEIYPEEERNEIERIIEVAGREVPQLSVVGEVDHERMAEVYASADLLVAPSQWRECFPLASIESMACGTPVVAPRSGGFVELIEHGKTGYVVPAGPKAIDLTKVILEILDSDGVPQDMRESARRAVLRLSWREAADHFHGILRRAF